MTKPDIHVLTYRSTEYTRRSLRCLSRWAPGHRIVVLDNDSGRWYQDWLIGVFGVDPNIDLHFLDGANYANADEAYGVGKNWLLGMDGTDWVVQLDNDAYLAPGWFETLEAYRAAFPDVGLWALYRTPPHTVLSKRTSGALTLSVPSMISGCALYFDRTKGIRWPEGPQDYSTHPLAKDIGTFTGPDVAFGERWRAAGFELGWTEPDVGRHCWQLGRQEGYR